MIDKIILASQSRVRKEILNSNDINCKVVPSNVDEDSVKISLANEKSTPEDISKNLAELKANKVSLLFKNELVIGADSVLDLEGKVISKPNNRIEALDILKSLNNRVHYLISSVCVSLNGQMTWNYTDKAKLTMKNFSTNQLEDYLAKISDENLYAYNVYQIEGIGKNLFSEIEGDKDTIMGLPIKKIKEYLDNYK